jgi:four helix bundle protein
MHNYKELIIWKKAIKMAVEVYKIAYLFPPSERYELTSQVKRAVVSVASNIAEGAGRNTNNEFVHFLGIANGSSFELVTQLIIAAELGLVSYDRVNPVIDELEQIQKMIYAFKETLKNQKK